MPNHFASQFVSCSAALLLLACADDKTRSAVVTKFTLHECKQSGASGTLATGRETADYVGLECVAWRMDGAEAKIDLINRVEGCGFDGGNPSETRWTPELEQTASDALRFRVSWEFEGPSACGSCLHDFSIAAKGLALGEAALHLNIETRSCNKDCAWDRDALSIPAAESGEGIRCRYLDWNRVTIAAYAGKLGGPARAGECDEGLVATEIDGASVCLKACEADDACAPPLTKCDTGVCKLTDSW